MKIEEVEALAAKIDGLWIDSQIPIHQAIEALRAEAWYPIERAEEMGVKDGGNVLLFRIDYFVIGWWDADYQCWMNYEGEIKPSHFKRISPPEAK
jgi:hypothetical protein